jgi:hypothetical protein
MKSEKLTVKVTTEIIAEYEQYIVMAIYLNGKFSKVFTIDLYEEKAY